MAIRGLARSRRQKKKDGRVFTTRYRVPSSWRVNLTLVIGEGIIDPDLAVMRIERLDGEVLAVLSNFGCHASVAFTSQNFSGDYPGEAMAALESILGERRSFYRPMGRLQTLTPPWKCPTGGRARMPTPAGWGASLPLRCSKPWNGSLFRTARI